MRRRVIITLGLLGGAVAGGTAATASPPPYSLAVGVGPPVANAGLQRTVSASGKAGVGHARGAVLLVFLASRPCKSSPLKEQDFIHRGPVINRNVRHAFKAGRYFTPNRIGKHYVCGYLYTRPIVDATATNTYGVTIPGSMAPF